MPPRSPLPPRFGLEAAWMRTADRDPLAPPAWNLMRDWLHSRVGEHISVDQFIAEQRFVYQDASPVRAHDEYEPNLFVWFHRDIAPETEVPGEIQVVYRDERIMIVDKPPFLSSIPRGKHIQQSVVVKLRREFDLPELTPLHRLDRVTSGLLLMATERRWRGPYQSKFMQPGEVQKSYVALADADEKLAEPRTVRSHISKTRGILKAETIADAPANAESIVTLVDTITWPETGERRGVYHLVPRTGKTHQLRMHMSGLGVPIDGDPLYPHTQDVAIDDFSTPLQLLARELRFTDPVTGENRTFVSSRALPLR